MVYTYFDIGRMIVEEEQQGETRAAYGKHILKNLSLQLTEKFGQGFSVDNLQNMRQFYLTYSIYETASRKFILSWSHYLVLMKIDNPNERSFYEIESAANNWSLKQLKRNYHFNIYATEYSLYLPDKQLLQQKLAEWLLEFEEEHSEENLE